MTVTKQEIAYALSDVTGLSVKTGKVPVDTLFDTIRARYRQFAAFTCRLRTWQKMLK